MNTHRNTQTLTNVMHVHNSHIHQENSHTQFCKHICALKHDTHTIQKHTCKHTHAHTHSDLPLGWQTGKRNGYISGLWWPRVPVKSQSLPLERIHCSLPWGTKGRARGQIPRYMISCMNSWRTRPNSCLYFSAKCSLSSRTALKRAALTVRWETGNG
jgi:hypothetical protein